MKNYILALLALTSCVESHAPKEDIPATPKNSVTVEKRDTEVVSGELSLKVTESDNAGYGFEILQGANTLIIQPHIPAIQGIKGFETDQQASIVGNYMIYKINNGIMPPSISIQDLDSLGINY